MDGIRFSFGMLYVEWLQYFQGGKGETAWIGSILIGVYNIGGEYFQEGCIIFKEERGDSVGTFHLDRYIYTIGT